jgi:hypothetical protein
MTRIIRHPILILAVVMLCLGSAVSVSHAQQPPDKGIYVLNLDGYGGAIFVGRKSDVGPGSVQACGPCNTTPKILAVLAGPFGSTDAANYDLCKNATNPHGSPLGVSRIDAYGVKNLDADNMPDCSQYKNPPPPAATVVQGPATGGSGSTGASGSSGPNPTATPSPLQAHLDCGNYVEVQSPAPVAVGRPTNSGLPSPCDVIIDSYDHFGPQICVTAPNASSLAGLTSDGIVVSSPSGCEDAAFLETDWFETFSACPVSGICVDPPQPGSSIPSNRASIGLHNVAIRVTQGSATVNLNLQVNVLGSLVTNPPFPQGICPSGVTGTLTGGPTRFTLSVTNPNPSPAGDSYISYLRLQNSVNASGIQPAWDTTPGSGSSLGTNPLQVTDPVTGQVLNPTGGISGSPRAAVPGSGMTSSFVLTALPASSSLDPSKQFLVTAYFGNFLTSCELDVTLGGPAGSARAPGVLNAFTPITGGNTAGGGTNGSGGGSSGGGTSGGGTTSNSSAAWSGTWNTDFGPMTLNVSGNNVTGTYVANSGKLTGTISGNTINGTWSELPTYAAPDHAGDFQFTLSSAGGGFSGQWRYGSSGDWSSWNGTKGGSGGGGGSGGSSGGGSSSNCVDLFGIQVCF